MRVTTLLVTAALLLVSTAAWAHPCKDGDDTDDDCKEYEAFMAPGGTFQFYAPAKGKPYFGGGVQIAPVQWAHDNNDYGPSRGAIFFQASFLQSASSEHVLGIYEGGVNLAFERNAKRNFAIPYFGFATGGMFQQGSPDAGYLYPFAGMHVVWTPNFNVDVSGGYLFPLVHADDLRGFRAQASLRIHAW